MVIRIEAQHYTNDEEFWQLKSCAIEREGKWVEVIDNLPIVSSSDALTA
jgi:hypothetical protein